MMTDPIADMLTRIRNAAMVRKAQVELPFSKLKLAIANVLAREGYLAKAEETKVGRLSYLLLTLKYDNGQSAVSTLRRLSKPGQRQYVKADEIKDVLNGFGVAILSTPQGILTDKEARAAGVGGEMICEVY
jgi:small subunit ribosomal protein S8